MKTIFLAERERHVLAALRLLIEQHPELTIMGEARSEEGLLRQVCTQTPNLILLDWYLVGIQPQRLINVLRELCPATLLVALSVRPEVEELAKEYQLDGFISKQGPAEEFLALLDRFVSGEFPKLEDTCKT